MTPVTTCHCPRIVPSRLAAFGTIALGMAVALGGVGCESSTSPAAMSRFRAPPPLAESDSPSAAPPVEPASRGTPPIAPPSHATPPDIQPGTPPAVQPATPPAVAPAALPSTAPSSIPLHATVTRQAWTFGEALGFILVTDHFRLHTTIADGPALRELPILMEGALRHYTSALGPLPMPDEPMRSSIFAKRSEWASHTRRKMPREADTYLAIGRGGYTTDGESVLFDIGRDDTFTIAVHEGWHQYTQTVFKDRLPVWLEEGIACWMEGVRFRRDSVSPSFLPWRNFERYGELRDAERAGRLVPFAELVKSTPQEALGKGKGTLLTYYAQVWALVHFLNEGENGRYRDGLRQAVADAAAGKMVTRLMKSTAIPAEARRPWVIMRSGKWMAMEYFNPNLDELAAQYDAFVKRIVNNGNGQRVWRGESPLAGGG